MNCKTFVLIVAALVSGIAAAGWEFSDISVRQRWPWDRKVDIDFVARQTDAQASRLRAARLAVQLNGAALAAADLDQTVVLGEGHHRITWTPPLDGSFPSEIKDPQVTLTAAEDVPDVGYMTVDLASGRIDYQPMSFSNTVNATTHYKTTSMAFRYIPSTWSSQWRNQMGKTTFRMGSDCTRTDLGISDADRYREKPADVTLTRAFFLGVFPMTRGQYRLLGGTADGDDTKPILRVTYDGLRGKDGTSSSYCFPRSRSIDVDKPIGRLRQRTGLDFDFPTEAQWEYACRAGTESDFFFTESGDLLTQLKEYSPVGTFAEVGSKKPNPWGLYDLIGCGHQWTTTCGRLSTAAADSGVRHAGGIDPVGPQTQMEEYPYRACRGSHWGATGNIGKRVLRSTYRYIQRTNCSGGELENSGCRLALTLDIE